MLGETWNLAKGFGPFGLSRNWILVNDNVDYINRQNYSLPNIHITIIQLNSKNLTFN